MDHLTRHDDGPLLSLFQTVMGDNSDEHFGDLVRWADRASVEADLRGHPFSRGDAMGRRKDELLIEAIKSLIIENCWSTEGSHPMLVVNPEDILIDWFQAQPSLIRTLNDMSPIGWREEAGELADMLIERGHAIAAAGHGTANEDPRYWLHRQGNKTIRSLKLIHPEILDSIRLSALALESSQTMVVERTTGIPDNPNEMHIAEVTIANTAAALVSERERAKSWLNSKIRGGEMTILLERLHASIGLTKLRYFTDQLWVPYPDAFVALGLEPVPSLKLFQDNGMLQMDPKTAMRAVLVIGDEKGCLFTREASAHISTLWCCHESLAPENCMASKLPDISEGKGTKTRAVDPSQLFTPKRLRAIAMVSHEK